MKGYYIGVKNDLLEQKHRKNMGSSVWEFMWLIDKTTSISENGIGTILGGRPIKLDEIADELGVSRSTTSENLTKLEKQGYVNIINAPYGLIITVNKSSKIFGKTKKTIKVEDSEKTKPRSENRTEDSEKTKRTIYNTITIQETIQPPEQSSEKPKFSQEGADLIKSFIIINPACKKYYDRPPQRQACDTLIETYGFTRVKSVIETTLPKTNRMQYMPTITTPVQLLEKWSSLEAGILKFKGKQTEKPKVAFV